MSLHAVVLAGGYGTRLLPFTRRTPKHLLPIGDEPVIAHQLHRLAAAGVESVVLATSYHADAFRPALGDGDAYGVRLRYSREEHPLGTGGALRHACGLLDLASDDDVLVLNGDLITEHDLGAQVAAHRAHRECAVRAGDAPPVLATIHGRAVPHASAYGLLHLDEAGRVTAFEEKPPGAPAGVVNAGTYVVSPALVDLVPVDAVVSLEREVFPEASERGGVFVHRDDAPFHDIGTPAALLAANLAWARERDLDAVDLRAGAVAGTPDAGAISGSLLLGGSRVAADAIVNGCIIGPGAVVGAGAVLDDCVIGDDAVVTPGVRARRVTLDVGERLGQEPHQRLEGSPAETVGPRARSGDEHLRDE